MSAKDGTGPGTAWPLPKFHFEVSFGDGAPIGFQEVSGLDVETRPLDDRAGNSPAFSSVKMPGIRKTANVTLKKGGFAGDSTLWDWVAEVKINTVERRAVTIRLLDEAGAPAMIWRLVNAFPVKVQGTDLKAEGNEVVIETLELAHEGITIETG
ncbi:conserved hypothetical phage tail region protein [Rhodovulum sp. ES.010]|uniref:phage tail protein n=1 Tax=Rhodovulum sp. ES.010 TaxID=1882821 RepID=UPI00092BD34A|nr:phage tail protein [Rhodovulum sp. ES.010]SIO51683.1 conserved hypothetical phage tail region protein [Rhodovulum sp. ES.010]